jgi:hypothetical protein
MSTASVARVLSEQSQMKDYFEDEKEKIERKKLKEMSKEPIDDEIFKSGLSCLGKTFNNARHAYLSLNISNHQLVSIVVSSKNKINCSRVLRNTSIYRQWTFQIIT